MVNEVVEGDIVVVDELEVFQVMRVGCGCRTYSSLVGKEDVM